MQATDKNTFYAGFSRYYETHNPTLTCPNEENDLFTTSTSNVGNKSLTYSIGLITVDELMLGGLVDGYLNRLSYTYSSHNYWTMSPREFQSENTAAIGFRSYTSGMANSSWITDSIGVRGVINLKLDVEISNGIGTSNDPFVVQTT